MSEADEPDVESEDWASLTDREMLSYAWSVLSKVEREIPHSEILWAEVATAERHLRLRLRD